MKSFCVIVARTILTVVLLAIFASGLDAGSWLMNQPDSFTVLGGAALCIFDCAFFGLVIYVIWRGTINSVLFSEEEKEEDDIPPANRK